MSKILRVKTQLTDAAALRGALERLAAAGLRVQIAPDMTTNSLDLVDYYGNHTRCAAMITRDDLLKHYGMSYGLYGGLGLVWNGSGFDLAQDHLDERIPQHQALVGQINQFYATSYVYSYAEANGYTVEEETLPDGTARVILHQYAGGY